MNISIVQSLHFKPLKVSHAEALLKFEIKNKGYFSKFIAPRSSTIFTNSGIIAHIESELSTKNLRAFVLLQGDEIIARANIRNISAKGTAEVGYRVAEGQVGKSIASKCAAFLIEQAKLMNLVKLTAYVMSNNPASEKVLTNNGFELILCLPNEFSHDGQILHGFEYGLDLKKII